MTENSKRGFAGRLAKSFVQSKLTPVIAVTSILLGIGAVFLTPKEEEPQITVPMIDIQTVVPGFEAKEVERMVTEPIEREVWGLDGVEYVYSSSRPNWSMVTVRFKVNEPMEPSLVKIHHKLMSLRAKLPAAAMPSDVKSFSIDDVPFLILTFSSAQVDDFKLRSLVAPLARELSSTPDLGRVELLGGLKRAIRVIVDPAKLASRGVSLLSVAQALQANDAHAPVGKNWGKTAVYDVEIGGKMGSAQDVQAIVVGQRAGGIVRIRDLAQVVDGPEERTRMSMLLDKESPQAKNAVSIVFAKRKGTNVVSLASDLLDRARLFSKGLPGNVQMSVLRNYGATADAKSRELIEHLLLATLSVSVLIAIFMGLRASLVVATAIPVTLALTLALYYFLGYTLNRVTLFALIFSIGILVDDAIVVVENIERHLKTNRKGGVIAPTIRAVSEVGDPTILATFAVIASVLPMAFVRGLMGPYMRPIPVGASLAMMLSLLVAFIVTPWAAVKLLDTKHYAVEAAAEKAARPNWLDRAYCALMEQLLGRKTRALQLGLVSVVLLVAAASLVYFKVVRVQMLPFDNKNEFQVLIDYPSTTPLTQSSAWSVELGKKLVQHPEIKRVQVFAGEPAPFSFSGMVKHTFLRQGDAMNDLQIELTDKDERKIKSHDIIQEVRGEIAQFGLEKNALTKVLEVPPGPPVMATVVAEVYGPDEATRKKVAEEIRGIFSAQPGIVDIDYSWRAGRPRQVYSFDQYQGGMLGARADQVVGLGSFIFSENPLIALDDSSSPEPVSVNLSIADAVRSSAHPFLGQSIPSFESGTLPAERVIQAPVIRETDTLNRKNLKPVNYVLAEIAGGEAPVYQITNLAPKIHYPTQTAEVPWNTRTPVVKWDGEWFMTYEVFRDLGSAFAVVMVLIYVLVLGWFRSFAVPLVIMTPIPISLIGIFPGHAIFNAAFTAPSMIGFIAGAGIIVRNSIILVDFIEHQLKEGMALKEAVISAGVLRFRPMLLTAAAVIVGSSVMLFDPIFQGLAISLMFGSIAATILSRLAVPVLYYWFTGKSRVKYLKQLQQAGESE
ncbi:efflux RND transporter permease subunit [Bdellovibrionota bacterium FG-1]